MFDLVYMTNAYIIIMFEGKYLPNRRIIIIIMFAYIKLCGK